MPAIQQTVAPAMVTRIIFSRRSHFRAPALSDRTHAAPMRCFVEAVRAHSPSISRHLTKANSRLGE
ncbi:protein of unknown function (plasmid) [Rhodovastum atsumiense]|nr:protein of unknown function [Rhodovastum atsumiense]